MDQPPAATSGMNEAGHARPGARVKSLAARRVTWLIALVTLTSPSSATDRFTLLIEALCASVAASHARGLAGPVIVLIWGRLRRMAARFAAATAIPAAPGRASRPARSSPAQSRAAALSRRGADARPRLPGGFGWLIRLSPAAACHGGQLQRLLADPEMAALLAASPRMGARAAAAVPDARRRSRRPVCSRRPTARGGRPPAPKHPGKRQQPARRRSGRRGRRAAIHIAARRAICGLSRRAATAWGTPSRPLPLLA